MLHGVFFNARVSRRDHVVVFVVRAFRQEGGPRNPHEIIDHGFFALDALPRRHDARHARAARRSVRAARRSSRALVTSAAALMAAWRETRPDSEEP